MKHQLEELPLVPTQAQWVEVDLLLSREKTDPAAYQGRLDKLTTEESMMSLLLEAV